MSTAREQLYQNNLKKADLLKFDKLRNYDPYPYQVRYHNDANPRKALQSANKIGKTWAVCAEDGFDLTGEYPDWWEGYKFKGPVRLVAGGINNDKTRDLLQKALFGDPVLWEESLGTGWIPKRCIGKIQKKRGVPNAFGHVKIKHYTDGVYDGWSQIAFQSYEAGKEAWMGDEIDVFHLDEEPPEDIFDQAGRGCISSGGLIKMSYTPENGKTNVVRRVEEDYSMHGAGWIDVAGEDFSLPLGKDEVIEFKTIRTLKGKPGHLTEAKALLAAKSFPVYQLPMRAKGIPVLGSGLVFPYSEEDIKVDPFTIPDHWKHGAAMDFGGSASTAHATTWGAFAYDELTDTIYLYDCLKINDKEISGVATDIKVRPTSWIPIQWPHDGNKTLGEGGPTKVQYEKYGLNMFNNEENPDKSHFTNPPEEGKREGTGGIQIMPGITEISNRISDGRFKVFSTLTEWFDEYRNYHQKDGKIVDENDDLMAMTRYGVQSIRHYITSVVKRKKINMNPTGSWLS
jgi:phage terminase large subunit-like protein